MGSQTSTSRHKALSDAHQSGIPGIGPVSVSESNTRHPIVSSKHHPQHSVPLASVPEGKTSSVVYAGEAIQQLSSSDDDVVPCVFSWTHGGHNVYLTGSFNIWSTENKIKLIRSGHEFSIILNLKQGIHLYKFIVDDQWKYAPEQQTQSDEHGNINNILDITNFKHYNFKILSEWEQARRAVYHQYTPQPSEYSADAPTIPILLSKSTCMAADPLPRGGIPLHCISNHLYHDANAPSIFGPHISCVAGTQRWRVDNAEIVSRQKYATLIYITKNPLYPMPIDESDEQFSQNCLRSLIRFKSEPVAAIETNSGCARGAQSVSNESMTSRGDAWITHSVQVKRSTSEFNP